MASKSSVFTYFEETMIFNWNSLIYAGEFNKKDEVIGVVPAYTLDYCHGKALLYNSHGRGLEPILSGRGNLFRTRFTVTGYHSIVVIAQKHFGCYSWKFTDGSGDNYMWRVNFGAGRWRLLDINKEVVAEFRRSNFRMSLQGRLTLHKDVREALLALILLSCRLVHIHIRKSESSRS